MLVAIEEIENAVMRVIALETETIKIVPNIPTFPTTHPILRYIITPKMVSTLGRKTPLKVPNWFLPFLISDSLFDMREDYNIAQKPATNYEGWL